MLFVSRLKNELQPCFLAIASLVLNHVFECVAVLSPPAPVVYAIMRSSSPINRALAIPALPHDCHYAVQPASIEKCSVGPTCRKPMFARVVFVSSPWKCTLLCVDTRGEPTVRWVIWTTAPLGLIYGRLRRGLQLVFSIKFRCSCLMLIY